jgi:uncharacterized GH25 family protein
MRKILFVTIFLVLHTLVLAACSSSTAPATQTTAQVNIKIETNPNPARAGDVEMALIITDQNGNPIEGAKVDVSADHTDMSGMNMGGPATEQGAGKYAIKANFSMSGNWKITVFVRKGELDVKRDLPLVIK